GKPGGTGGMPAPYATKRTELALFNLAEDVGETRNVAAEHPEIVARLTKLADAMRADLGDSLTGRKGTENRPPGRVGG
ncbi:MAG TPA: arylsulfatase, partial [Planctomycetaceae bacterium]